MIHESLLDIEETEGKASFLIAILWCTICVYNSPSLSLWKNTGEAEYNKLAGEDPLVKMGLVHKTNKLFCQYLVGPFAFVIG
jgi:hypothetical protein